jgi:hypothetical protein
VILHRLLEPGQRERPVLAMRRENRARGLERAALRVASLGFAPVVARDVVARATELPDRGHDPDRRSECVRLRAIHDDARAREPARARGRDERDDSFERTVLRTSFNSETSAHVATHRLVRAAALRRW